MYSLQNFATKLQEIMDERQVTPLMLGQALAINRNTITRYLQGKLSPRYHTFCKMLEYFNCTADFLLALEEYNSTTCFCKIPSFQKQFRYLLDTHKMSQYRLHQLTNMSYDNFTKWLTGRSQPLIDNLVKLATAFDLTVDCLIGHSK